MRRLALAGVLTLASVFGSVEAGATPDDDTTRIGIFLGPRYVPHGHFIDEAQASGDPVSSSTPVNGQGLLSFGYKPESYLEVALEVGYSFDSFTLQTGPITITSVPVVATVRFTPWPGRVYPYVGLGGGYMLNFFSGAPPAYGSSSGELENHTYTFHGLAGVGFDLTRQWSLFAEYRFEWSTPDIEPIGELQTGGSVLLLGVSFVFEPEASLAPHDHL